MLWLGAAAGFEFEPGMIRVLSGSEGNNSGDVGVGMHDDMELEQERKGDLSEMRKLK